ncbi:MAG: hypothetical protein GY711_10600 [bacterium]|nr:hypothetical protein [bacterium]
MRATDELLKLLLPEADAAGLERARRITCFARALVEGARASVPPAEGVDAERAAVELERHARRRVLRALQDLLRAYLHALLPADSFAWFGASELDHQAAWSVLEEHRGETPRPASVPRPGESSVAVTRRLIDCAERYGLEAARLSAWRARLVWVEEGPYAAIASLDRVVSATDGAQSREAVADRAAARLDRGDVRGARAVLEEAGIGSEGEDRAARLALWSRFLLDSDTARTVPALGAASGPVPAPLVRMRELWPSRASVLAGTPSTWSGRTAPLADECDRRAHGAAVLAVFARAGGHAVALHLSVAPGLERGVELWCAERDGAWIDPDAPEHQLVLEADVVVRRATLDRELGSLGSRSAATVLVPVLDDVREVAGWVHLEFEHHLLPGPGRLAALAAAWRARVLDAGRANDEPDASRAGTAAIGRWPCVASPAERSEEARVLCALVDAVGPKTSHRRWWGYVVHAAARPVASGGEGLRADTPGSARALARAIATGGVVRFEDPEPGLSVHAAAASGLVLPIALGPRVLGLVAIESERRRDFRSFDVSRALALAAEHALALRVACFGSWHARRFGSNVTLPATQPDFARFAARLIAVGRSRVPLVLCGPACVGKGVLARWMHFEGDEGARLRECDGALDAREVDELFEDPDGTLVLRGIDTLGAEAQRRILDRVRSDARGPRLVVATRDPVAAAAERGVLHPDLARALERLQVFVPPLADRRLELPGLVRFLARSIAARENREAPRLADDALGLLWRQAWGGNLASLENVIFKLVLHHEGQLLEAADVERILGPYGVALTKRLPSRRPRRLDLLAALATTIKPTGRLNKRRAAAYLGWDPDTLVARMEDAALTDPPPAPEAWGVPPTRSGV